MIIVDTREQKWDHIRQYFDEHGIEYVVQKLDEGDYFNTEQPLIVIDRKANLLEICRNLSSGKGNIIRFMNECKRAKNKHIRFIVLIEGTNCRRTSDLATWKSKYSKHTGKWLADKMFGMTVSYDVEWLFCKKNETAKKILELLEYEKGDLYENTESADFKAPENT